jgi:hypothetical protein
LFTTVQILYYRYSKYFEAGWPLSAMLLKTQYNHPRKASTKSRGHEHQHVLPSRDALGQPNLEDKRALLSITRTGTERWGHLVECPSKE